MINALILDTSPLGLVTQKPGKAEADACRVWLANCMRTGCRVYVPEVADYEVRRELKRTGATAGIARLDTFNADVPGRYLPLTTEAMRLAADLWAQSRNRGIVTADIYALDGDVILCAQALILALPPAEILVATSNIKHISHFLAADLWNNIHL